ncbi:MAG TPA: Hsp20/alpha crystallin family protein [Patescibacteria group bacterium]
MPSIRWNPWSMDRFLDEDWDLPTIPLLSRLSGQGLNIYETETEVVAELALPGIPEDRIDITVDNGIVRISANSQESADDKNKRRYYMAQMNSTYNYAFRLPEGVDPDKEPICELNYGVLSMHFSKIHKTEPKKLKISKKSGVNQHG